ncbi:MAG: PepSY domain-containing protein [Candidatus Melainabacteria bacterium]|nr:PepSY domain-containing protein [Candidatus Melainabacteria bacterium]
MKKILSSIILFLISTGFAFATCGYHAPQAQVQTRQKSSVTVSDEVKNFKKLAVVSKKDAKKFATSQYNGKVKKVELLKEDGTLVWKLEIKGEEGQKELFIDPANGNFLGYGLTK